MTEERNVWTFPRHGVTVRWKPREKRFIVRMGKDGGRFVQSVRVKDPEVVRTLMSAMDSGRCPVGDDAWPVAVCRENSLPADGRWHTPPYAVVSEPSADGDRQVEYFTDPVEAVDAAVNAWSSADGSHVRIIACEIADDFPVTGSYTSCLWASDRDTVSDEDTWRGTLPVVISGNSLVIRVTDVCSKLGISPNELVEVTVRRMKR